MATTISNYLLTRLKGLGVDHIFGIPGDFILPFFQAMSDSDISHVAACNELNAGYAADGYARLKGLGVAAVTYGPGSFSIVNAVAGAYAESVPLLVISGGPDTQAYRSQPVLHHTLPKKYNASLKIFGQITAYATLLDDLEEATAKIDEALRICLSQNKPVFLEIPTNIQVSPCPEPTIFQRLAPLRDDTAVAAAVSDILTRVERGKRTVLIPGHEIHRGNLQEKMLTLLEKTGLPTASMFIGKADFLEQHPQCVGAYQGAGSLGEVSAYVEAADTVLFLGVVLSDFNLGGFTANLTAEQVVSALDQQVVTATGTYVDVPLSDLIDGLIEALPRGKADTSAPAQMFSHKTSLPYKADPTAPMTNKRFYDRMAHFVRTGDIVTSDAGCAINITQLQFPDGVTYLASCYWASIGMGFAAAFGACFAAKPGQRVVALEGDGSFQMTAQELSSMSRYNCPAIIFVVNNKGYTAERLIHDGPFNDIANWRYHRLAAAFGGVGLDVHTEGDLEQALIQAEAHTGPGPLLIEIHVDPWDASEAFTLMSETLRSH
ncbi:MAG: alpha-keto acid decarboxylase family protein [Pseudomonadales bacterium]|nr:alpha-keto acid decarboxylase family protein [Halioglobus sp.]MCP5193806.1 alpha-keto acid decarboxylase family protein [Pseudomonadales bacterium]